MRILSAYCVMFVCIDVVVIVVKVKKRIGVLQDFERSKLEASLKKAGVANKYVTKVTEKVVHQIKQEMSTVQIKRLAVAELRKLDTASARSYALGTEARKPIYLTRYE